MSSSQDWEKMDGKRVRTAWFINRIPDMQPYVEQREGHTLTLSVVYLGDRSEIWIVEHEAGRGEIARYNARSMESIHWL